MKLYDEEENMRFGNGTMYQTMSKLSAIILKKSSFPNGANIILLSTKGKDECFKNVNTPFQNLVYNKYGGLKHVS